jgi:Flp pilus assembly protein TadD
LPDDVGRPEEAIAAYREALKFAHCRARLQPGIALAKQGRHGEARTNLLRAIELKPGIRTPTIFGHTSLAHGQSRAAVSAFETALRLNANHVRALPFLARILAASDDASIRETEASCAFL